MKIREGVKKCTKRVGCAFGASDILDDIAGVNDQIGENAKNIANSIESYRYLVPYLSFYYDNEIAKNIHARLFEKYRDCNKGKDLAIVACGPSLDDYKVIKDALHIGINRAFLKKEIRMDYIFMHDRQLVEECGEEIKKYNADKFIAFATGKGNAKLFNASSEQVKEIGAKRFLISDVAIEDTVGGQFDVIQMDITKGLLFDRGGGTVFSALQFALFTHPRRLYLVGCDCSEDGYFRGAKTKIKQSLLGKTEYLWKEANVFIEQYYPDIEVISVNPVKLKGVFKNLYQ